MKSEICSGFDLYIAFFSALYWIMASSKKSLMEDEDLNELEKRIIQKIESYIDEKLKLIIEKAKIMKDYFEMSFL